MKANIFQIKLTIGTYRKTLKRDVPKNMEELCRQKEIRIQEYKLLDSENIQEIGRKLNYFWEKFSGRLNTIYGYFNFFIPFQALQVPEYIRKANVEQDSEQEESTVQNSNISQEDSTSPDNPKNNSNDNPNNNSDNDLNDNSEQLTELIKFYEKAIKIEKKKIAWLQSIISNFMKAFCQPKNPDLYKDLFSYLKYENELEEELKKEEQDHSDDYYNGMTNAEQITLIKEYGRQLDAYITETEGHDELICVLVERLEEQKKGP